MKKDWEINPNLYLTDSKGDFILKKDGTPKKKAGRPKGSKSNYNFHSKTKAKIAARQSLKSKKKTIKKLESQLKNKKQYLYRIRKNNKIIIIITFINYDVGFRN